MCCRLRGDVGCASGGTYDTKGLPHRLSDEGETRVEVLRVVHGKKPSQQILVEDLDVLLFQATPEREEGRGQGGGGGGGGGERERERERERE